MPRFESGSPHEVDVRAWKQHVVDPRPGVLPFLDVTRILQRAVGPVDTRTHERGSVRGKVTFSDEGIAFSRVRSLPDLPALVRYDAVTGLRIAARFFEIAFTVSGAAATVAFAPRRESGRARLEQDLALRLPDHLERALPDATKGTPLPATGRRPMSEPPSAAGAFDDLESRMSGLGSSLVPPRSEQPAPPRSGLGDGLVCGSDEDE